MNPHWNPLVDETFLMFSPSHLIAIVLLGLIGVSLYLCRVKIRESLILQSFIRWGIILSLAVPEFILNIWYVQHGLWNIKTTLPLELCSIMLILSVIMLLTDSRLLYGFVFFAGVGGALQAIVTPNLGYPFPHFLFFHFFIVHIAIIAAALYMTWIQQYKPDWKDIVRTMIFLNVLVVAVGALNYKLDTNYMFLMHKPSTASLLDLLGPHPYYLLAEEAIALGMFSIMYLMCFAIRGKRKQSKKGMDQLDDTPHE
ncbi:TIGR02206 family membrane protein [Paenibacillus sp. RC67]|uniref:YwaF family protein n=1 Tax=Paenibacillus sp. RC67 TaxID=3039392 RepID=UPI0024AD7C6F|nr:TIGR02206 family membrane protein [Paenibacillus sp. RC67]